MISTANPFCLFVPQAFHFRLEGFLTHVLQLWGGLRTTAGRVVGGLNPHASIIMAIILAKGDHLVQKFLDDHIRGPFFGSIETIDVDMTIKGILSLAGQLRRQDPDLTFKQAARKARQQIASHFTQLFEQHLYAIKMSTASDATLGSVNPMWRESVRSATGWRQLLAVGAYQAPCAVSRLMTGGLYMHGEPEFVVVDGRKKARFIEDWDLQTVEQFCCQTIQLAQENKLRLVMPSKDRVSGSETLFLTMFSDAAKKAGVSFKKVIADDFFAQLTDPRCEYIRGGWCAVASNLYGDLNVDQVVRKHGDWACSSTLPCENGGVVEEQPGGTNQAMLLAYNQGAKVCHGFLDVMYMFARQIARSSPSQAEQANRLYSICEGIYNGRSSWDSVSLVNDMHSACKAEGVLFS